MTAVSTKINTQTIPQSSPWAAVSSAQRGCCATVKADEVDLSKNGKFDKSEAKKDFWMGIKKPFLDVYNYAKQNPMQFGIITVASIGLMALAAVFPPVGLALTGIGCYFIGNPLVKGIKELHNAKNGDDKEKACAQFGESLTYVVLTFGADALTKMFPAKKVAAVGSAVESVHKGSKHTLRFFSNATDVASFAPKAKVAAVLTGKGMIGAEISYNTGK